MSLIKWEEKYVTGIERIDGEHQQLVRMINELHSAMRHGQTKQVLEKVLCDLTAYAHFHFAGEEQLMQACNFRGYTAHQQTHAEFRAKIGSFQEKFRRESISLPIEIFSFLRDWLTRHILEEDMQYVPHLQQ